MCFLSSLVRKKAIKIRPKGDFVVFEQAISNGENLRKQENLAFILKNS